MSSKHDDDCVWVSKPSNVRKYRGDDLTGQKFGRLTALCVEYNTADNHYYWKCLCDCGNITHASSWALKTPNRNGKKSCGCLAREILLSRSSTHGHSSELIYITWRNMKTRCYNPNYELYHRYGGRGIQICEEWQDFDNFYQWAINNGYKPHMSIDRIDNDKDYSPENCRWATPKMQARNTSRSRYIKYKGKTKTIAEWAEEYGVTYYILSGRIRRGWSMEDALFTPVRKRKAA